MTSSDAEFKIYLDLKSRIQDFLCFLSYEPTRIRTTVAKNATTPQSLPLNFIENFINGSSLKNLLELCLIEFNEVGYVLLLEGVLI